jgi:tol-pal system protein YbgF
LTRYCWIVVAGVALSACARQSDVNRLELQVRRLREETARADSARAVALDQIIALQRRTIDSLTRQLAQQENRLAGFRGDVRSDLTELQRQLVQVQELTGQSQQRLTELRGQIEARSQAVARGDTTGVSGLSAGPGPEQLYELSIQQLRRGSPATARIGFLKLIQDFPAHERAADAQFFVGETWGDKTGPDSAAAAYDRLVINYPNSSRVPTALYRLGVIAEQKRDRAAARQYYNRLIAGYPRSEEAALAREKLQALGR